MLRCSYVWKEVKFCGSRVCVEVEFYVEVKFCVEVEFCVEVQLCVEGEFVWTRSDFAWTCAIPSSSVPSPKSRTTTLQFRCLLYLFIKTDFLASEYCVCTRETIEKVHSEKLPSCLINGMIGK